MKTNTSELVGPALDWAVAKCENFDTRNNYVCQVIDADDIEYEFVCSADSHEHAEEQAQDAYPNSSVYEITYVDLYSPSTDWSQGGPIIEREAITLDFDAYDTDKLWEARHYAFDGTLLQKEFGTTPLIAAMRCYVVSKLGEFVDVPDELV